MVNFSIFNEMSLPIREIREFDTFFKILEKLNQVGLDKIRMDKPFTQYPEILPNKTFQELIGQIDRDKRRRLLSFINNKIAIIESPLIRDEEISEKENDIENEYFYNTQPTFGGLACCDIWNTIAVSFLSNKEWDKKKIVLQKKNILNKQKRDIDIYHLSRVRHLDAHRDFFNRLENYRKMEITPDNFWEKKQELFPNKIIFCKEVKQQIKDIDKTVFKQAITILIDIDSNRKSITDYNYSSESQFVKNNNKLNKLRYFTVDNKKLYFDKHIKSLSNANRIYFLEKENKIYIGYIGKHLPTKKFKK
jgi:hypothetical protein